jgi:hypothetical protein
VFTFLLGKLIENLDPHFYFLSPVQDAVRQNAPYFFGVFLELTARELEQQPPVLHQAVKMADAVLAGIAELSQSNDCPWRTLTTSYYEAFQLGRHLTGI